MVVRFDAAEEITENVRGKYPESPAAASEVAWRKLDLL